MSRKPRLLLLDAGAIFAALHHDAWDALVDHVLDVGAQIGEGVGHPERLSFTSATATR